MPRILRRVTLLASLTIINLINNKTMKTDHTYAAQIELTNIPEDSLKQWTNMPPISDELYNELVKEFNNERQYFFNDSYTLED